MDWRPFIDEEIFEAALWSIPIVAVIGLIVSTTNRRQPEVGGPTTSNILS